MRFSIRQLEFALSPCVTRQPFRFGGNTMTRAPMMTARARIESEAGEAVGHSADLLVPKWFEKDPAKSLREDVEALVESARRAADRVLEHEEATLFDHWWKLYRARVHGLPQDAPDRLVRGFGVALVERALMDAVCRAAELSFFDALKGDLFGMRPSAVHPELEGWSLAESLPDAPAESIALRHTIGLLDPLTASDLDPAALVGDGLPETLEDEITRYGLSWFKLKLGGDASADRERSLAFFDVVEKRVAEPRITVDGNEQFADVSVLARWLEELGSTPAGGRFLDALVSIEQPLPRSLSLDDEVGPALRELSRFAPIIIDEADSGVEAFPRALDLGYGGVSIKNCKGVIRALLHRGLCERRGAFQSAEDLTNLGVLALQQDLCTNAALGSAHVERNGHHYFRGLEHLPPAEAEAALAAHPELWERRDGAISLRIEDGRLDLRGLQAPGYGYASTIVWDERVPLEAWSFEER